MKDRHILFLASWYPSRESPFDGDFIQRHAFAASLVNRVTVLYTIKDDSLKTDYEIVENTGAIREIIVYFRGSFFRPLNLLKKFWGYRKGLKKIDSFDFVYLNVCYPAGIFALYLKYFFHKKFVLIEHWTDLTPERFILNPFYKRFLISRILKNAEIFMPVSSDLGNTLLRFSPGKEVKPLPNVVDTKRFRPEICERDRGKVRFLHLSSLNNDQKNITGMLNVVKRLAKENYLFEFHIGGNGDLLPIKQLIENNNLQKEIFTFPAIPYEKVAEMMCKFDVFVLFSNYENQPCVKAEAFSCGLPVIASNVGGMKESFPPDFGILVEKGNEEELFIAMKLVIEGRKFASKETMHQYAEENFSHVVISRQFKEVYEKVLNKKRN